MPEKHANADLQNAANALADEITRIGNEGGPKVPHEDVGALAYEILTGDWMSAYTKRVEAHNMRDLAKAFEDTYATSPLRAIIVSDLRRLSRDAEKAAEVMATQKHETTLAAALTLSTGTLVSSLDEAWSLMDFLVGWPMMTHQRPAIADVVAKALVERYPALGRVAPPPAGWIKNEEEAALWVQSISDLTGLPMSLKVTRPRLTE